MHSNGHRKSEHKAWIIYLMMEHSLTFWMQKDKEWSCITGFVSRLTRQVPLVEQELLTLPEHLSSPRVLVGFVLLDLCAICMLCRSLFVLLYFFVLIIALSVLLRYRDPDYPFDIIKLFFSFKILDHILEHSFMWHIS
jgi:hypothetical protein